jgi:hypothetical protein
VAIPRSAVDVSVALMAMGVENYVDVTDIAPNAEYLDLSTAESIESYSAAPGGNAVLTATRSKARIRHGSRPPRRPRVSDKPLAPAH